MPTARRRSLEEPLFGVSRSALGREWRLRTASDRDVRTLMRKYGLDEPVARIMAARSSDEASAIPFIGGRLDQHLPDPFVFRDMDKAADRIAWAIRHDEPVIIYGDYDADGATSGALLRRYLQAAGAKSLHYIPDRALEGYGGSRESIDNVRGMLDAAGAGPGRGLVIMMDCNSRAFDLLAYAKEQGISVVVGDHHKTEGTMPEAVAIVNPMRHDDPVAHKELVSVGIAFMMAIAVNRSLRQLGHFSASRPEPRLTELLELVAVGTVADVGRLTGLNRLLVSKGLELMQQSLMLEEPEVLARGGNIGLHQLMRRCGLGNGHVIRAEDIAFQIGPRINAAGRIAKSDTGISLLCTDSLANAQDLSYLLHNNNETRKAIEKQIVPEAWIQAEAQIREGARVLVVANPAWHHGVVGIVASRLRERSNLPSFVFGRNENHPEGLMVGSGRSIPGVDLGEAVIQGQVNGHFKGGGHAMAAGASVMRDQLGFFQNYMTQRLLRELDMAPQYPVTECDLVLDAGGVTLQLIDQLKKLEPCGQSNPAPVVALNGLRVQHARLVGRDSDSVACTFTNNAGQRLSGIAFRAADQPHGQALLAAAGNGFLHVLGNADANTFNGKTTAQFKVSDVAPA